MFKTRRLNEEDYNTLCNWWKWWRFPAPKQKMLPENGTCGIMISKDEIDICAGFIYFTNSSIAWVEFIVSNPDYREKDRTDAIRFLLESLSGIIKQKGFEVIYSSVKNENLIRSYLDAGYIKGSTNATELIYVI